MDTDKLLIDVQSRSGSGKQHAKQLRAKGMIPGIVYAAGAEPVKVQLPCRAAVKYINQVRGLSSIVRLRMDDQETTEGAIVKDHQVSNGRELLHIDFWKVTPETVVRTDADIKVVGIPKAVKFGGVMQVIRHTIPVKCEVKYIPEHIEVDVNNLNFGESVHVLDIPYPEGVRPIVTGRNFTLITITGRTPEEAQAEETEEPEE